MRRTTANLARLLLPCLLAGGFWGCAQDVAGKGGSELPGPLTVVVDVVPSTGSVLTGLQWRVWEQQDTVLLARASTEDSAGVLSLPNQTGTWVLEGWSDSLPARTPVTAVLGTAIPDSCIDSATTASSLRAGIDCGALSAPSMSDSAAVGARKPARISAVRLTSGLPAVRLRLSDSLGNALGDAAVAHLWELAGDSLLFLGELRRDAQGDLLMPRPLKAAWFVLEAWEGASGIPGNVQVRQPVGGHASGFARCGGEVPTLPQDETPVTIHECPALGIAPSSTGAADSTSQASPSRWALFGYSP